MRTLRQILGLALLGIALLGFAPQAAAQSNGRGTLTYTFAGDLSTKPQWAGANCD